MAWCATAPSGSSSLSIASWSLATVNACSSLSTGLIVSTRCQLKDSGLKTHTINNSNQKTAKGQLELHK